MDTIDERKAIIQSLNKDFFQDRVATVDMLRLDLVHPVISGNKWYKLKNNLKHAMEHDYETIVTFGGAHSNHLVATAAAAKLFHLKCVGIVRGLHAEKKLTETLKQCVEYGMEIKFLSRKEYDEKSESPGFKELSFNANKCLIIEEGGANQKGREGAGEIVTLILKKYTHVCLSVGSATTFIGVRNALPDAQKMLGFVPMKSGKYLQEYVAQQLQPEKSLNFQLFDHWHFGGFAKHDDELLAFMNSFYEMNNIPLDFVYTAKMMYGLRQLILSDYFSSDANLLCIHSGGLQGNDSIKDHLLF